MDQGAAPEGPRSRADRAEPARERSAQPSSQSIRAGRPQYTPTRLEQVAPLQKTTLDDAKRFHDQFYGANYGVFAVVGPVAPADVQKLAAELFGSWNSAKTYARS